MTWLTPSGDLADVARFLGVTQAKLNDSNVWSDLNLCVETAVEELERRVGPIVETTVTQRVESTGTAATLRFRPSEILTWDGVADVGSIRIDGQVVHAATGARLPAAGVVTYKAGWVTAGTAAPAWARSAALLLTRHLWRTQFGNQQASSSDPGTAWLWPRQVQSLIEGRELAPVVFA